jgi:hypothetical protein
LASTVVVRADLAEPIKASADASTLGQAPQVDMRLTHKLDAGRKRIPRTVTPYVPRRVEVIPHPKAVQITLNGRLLGSYGPELRFVSLPRGNSTLVFSNEACCFDKVVKIMAKDQRTELPVELRWKPGRVKVFVTPAVPADVVVGNQVTRPGQEVDVPIPSYLRSGRYVLLVKVSAQGFETEQISVTVRANMTTPIVVKLKKLP